MILVSDEGEDILPIANRKRERHSQFMPFSKAFEFSYFIFIINLGLGVPSAKDSIHQRFDLKI